MNKKFETQSKGAARLNKSMWTHGKEAYKKTKRLNTKHKLFLIPKL